MSNSLQPYGLQPSRLLCPGDSPGRNTVVGCHFLLHSIFPGIKLTSLTSPALASQFLTTNATWEAPTYELYHIIFAFLCQTYLTLFESLGTSMLLQMQMALFHSFLQLSNFLLHTHIHTHTHTTSPFPFFCCWIFRLLPCLGYCEQCCCEHWSAGIFPVQSFLWIQNYTQNNNKSFIEQQNYHMFYQKFSTYYLIVSENNSVLQALSSPFQR